MLLVLARTAQRRQRVGGLAGLRNEDRQLAGLERHVAVAELGGDVDIDRQMRKAFEPVPRDHAGVIRGAAGGDRYALERAEIERQRHRQRDALGHHIEIIRQRMADDFRLLVNLLGHEMAMVALVDEHDRGQRLEHGAVHDRALGVVDFGAGAADDGAVAVLQIADGIGERGKRNRIGADVHRAVAEADRQRRAFARADQEVLLAGKQKGERESAAQPRQRRLHRFDRRQPVFEFLADQMGDDLAIGFGGELGALALQLAPQLAEILDDAVVHDRELVGGVRMRVVLGRPAVRRPAGVADADRSRQRLARELQFQILEFALGTPSRQRAVLERGDAGGIVAAVFEALERVDEKRCDRLTADDSDNAAHPSR